MAKRKKEGLTPFGKAVKKRLIDKGMKHWQLADAVGVSIGYLQHIIYGRRSGTKYIAKIAEVLNINIEKYIA